MKPPCFRYRHWIPRALGVQGIVLYPYVLFSEAEENVRADIVHHELVHVRQVEELGRIRFYGRYLREYLGHLIRLRNHSRAYLAISFEQEAYLEQEKFRREIS